MKNVKEKPKVKTHITLILVIVIAILIVTSIIGILLYQQSTILSLSKNVNTISQQIKKMNAVPTATPTNTPTPTPTLIPLPTAIPTPALNKEKLNSCLKNADNAYTQGWTAYCQDTYHDAPNCNRLSVWQADSLENIKANAKTDCYNQYYAGN
jgi:hypothetical protein